MRELLTASLVLSTIRLSTPLILAALGGMFSERSGVINIALEGHDAGRRIYCRGGDLRGWESLARACWPAWPPACSIAAIHAVACIRYKADQVVTGTAINILMIGVPGF